MTSPDVTHLPSVSKSLWSAVQVKTSPLLNLMEYMWSVPLVKTRITLRQRWL